jgi:hypothetical protein
MILSRQTLQQMVANTKLATAHGSILGVSGLLTRQQIASTLDAYTLPPIKLVYDSSVDVDGVSTRVLPANKVIFLPPEGQPLGLHGVGCLRDGPGAGQQLRVRPVLRGRARHRRRGREAGSALPSVHLRGRCRYAGHREPELPDGRYGRLMAKAASTVHLTDDSGVAHTFGPDDKEALPGWAESKLAESWPADREDLWAEAPKKAAAKAPAKDDAGK